MKVYCENCTRRKLCILVPTIMTFMNKLNNCPSYKPTLLYWFKSLFKKTPDSKPVEGNDA